LVKNTEVTVKIITVQPGHRLSLQRHERRQEVWHILDHPMQVEVEDRAWVAQVGEQVRVPIGARHRLGNAGAQPARVLEIAFGDFDEDDIERFADDYSR
jgi:mannose-6-phosphate isomerase